MKYCRTGTCQRDAGMLGKCEFRHISVEEWGAKVQERHSHGEAVDTKSKTIRNVRTILEIIQVSTDQPNGNRGP